MEKNRYDCALKVIEANDSIIIHRHSNPDGDALGSQVGLYEIIRENYPEKRVYMVGDESERYGFISERAMDEVDDSLFCSSLSIILDTSSPALISDDRWRSAKDSLRFDHHLFIEKIADYEVVDSTYESSCGLIADFAKRRQSAGKGLSTIWRWPDMISKCQMFWEMMKSLLFSSALMNWLPGQRKLRGMP